MSSGELQNFVHCSEATIQKCTKVSLAYIWYWFNGVQLHALPEKINSYFKFSCDICSNSTPLVVEVYAVTLKYNVTLKFKNLPVCTYPADHGK